MSCGSCRLCPAGTQDAGPSAPRVQAEAYGVRRASGERIVALAGNPNTGKTTLFNALTGLRQHTGNWPGKTVTRAEGRFTVEDQRFRLVDLPGTYSLRAASADEEVARDFLLFGSPDATVVVVDATALERNLGLVYQVLEVADRVVVALNLVDEARRKGIHIDAAALAAELGVPVVPTAAAYGEGVAALEATICGVALGRLPTAPRPVAYSAAIEEAIATLRPAVERAAPGLPNARWVAVRLLEGDDDAATALRDGRLAALADRLRPRWDVDADGVAPGLASPASVGTATA